MQAKTQTLILKYTIGIKQSLVLLLFIPCMAKGSLPENYASMPQIFAPSPQVTQMMRFGEHSPNLFRGLIDISVPIHEVDLNGMKVPVEFKYHSSGIKYDDVDMELGLGWTLFVGGIINQSIRGVKDENYADSTSRFIKLAEDIDPRGLGPNAGTDDANLDAVAYGKEYEYPGVDHIFRTSHVVRDGEYDIFDFSFLGRNGSFFLNNGEYVVTCDTPVKVVKQNYGFIVTDETGICYTFEPLDIDYSEPYMRANCTYYLKTIISADKSDTITFNYTRAVLATQYLAVLRPVIMDSFHCKDHHIYDTAPAFGRFQHPDHIYTPNSMIKWFYPPRMDSIEYRGGKVVFEYLNQRDPRELSNVKIYDIKESPELLQTVSIENGAFAGDRKRLDKVIFRDNSGKEVYNYRFEYNGDPGQFRNNGIDYWGYFNSPSSSKYIPNFDYTSVGLEALVSPYKVNRESNFQMVSRGLLMKIVYPTKGYSRFTYEANAVTDNSGTHTYGGTRIKEIRNYDQTGAILNTISYNYESHKAVPFPRLSDFIRSEMHILRSEYSTDPGYPQPYLRHAYDYYTISPFSSRSYFICGSPVVYTKVIESHVDSSNGSNGKIEYDFEFVSDLSPAFTYHGTKSVTEHFRRDDLWRNGQLLGKRIYDKDDRQLYSIINTYVDINSTDYLNLDVNQKVRLFDETRNKNAMMLIRLYFSVNNPEYTPYNRFIQGSMFNYTNYYTTTGKRVLQRSYETVDGVTKDTRYEYNSDGLPIAIIQNSSAGDEIKTVNKYPADFISLSNPVYSGMVTQNIISPLIEQSIYKNDQFISLSRVNYGKFNSSLYAPRSQEYQNGQEGDLESRIVYHEYDLHGNPVYISKDDNIMEVYLWSYNSRHPLIRIQNATYSSVEYVLGPSAITSLADSPNPDVGSVNYYVKLLKDRLPNTLITSYTYKPSVGISTITDPSGRTTYYDYDDFGRLKSVTDDKENPINEYSYNYAQ